MVESKQQEQQEQEIFQWGVYQQHEEEQRTPEQQQRDIERHDGDEHYEDYADFMSFMLNEWQIEEDDVYTYNMNDFDDHDNAHIRLGILIGQLDTHRFVGEPEENLYDLQYLIHQQLDRIFNN